MIFKANPILYIFLQFIILMILNPKGLLNNASDSTYKTARFILYVTLIFAAHMSSSVFTEKIYKTKYTSNDGKSQDYFHHILAVPLVNSFLGMFYGFLKYEIAMRGTEYQPNTVPYQQYVRLGGLDVIITLLGNLAIVLSSYTTYNLIHCCSFLSVVLFAIFFSNVRDDNMRVGKSKLIISVFVCIGIFIFNYFGFHKQQNSVNKPLTLTSTLVFTGLLLFQGYRPDVQAHIRSEYHPSPSLLFYYTTTYIFSFLLIISIISFDLWKIVSFVWNHDTLAWDLMAHGCLGVFGDIFVYRLLLLHRQHIVPLVLTVRRLCTSLLNMAWFHHTMTFGQYIGLSIVGIGVFIELYANYLQNMSQKRTEKVQDHDQLEDTI